MNILYLTLEDFDSIHNGHSINTDLLREFQRYGHIVYVISPSERRKGFPTRCIKENGSLILKPKIGNIQKTNTFEKGLSTLIVGWLLKRIIKKNLKDVKFDLILYCTPPITFLSAIEYIKKRDTAKAYLLLKDIFPQNAVDLNMLSTKGLKGFLYHYFRKLEKKLYEISDRIGCMSPANVEYVLKHNPEINSQKVEVCPNSIEVIDKSINEDKKKEIRKKYILPIDKKIFIYGGNFGKPQGIPFLIECLRICSDLDCWFLIVGDGTERHLLEEYVERELPTNITLVRTLPIEEYDKLVAACDIGLIFLNHKFTIPNFPSRLLGYMAAKIPVLACTDSNTDIGKIIVEGNFGFWCESNDAHNFYDLVKKAINVNNRFGDNAFNYLMKYYNVKTVYTNIMRAIV